MRLSRIQLRFRLLTPNVVNPTKQQRGESPRPTAGPRAKTRSKSGLTVFDLALLCYEPARQRQTLRCNLAFRVYPNPAPHSRTHAHCYYIWQHLLGLKKMSSERGAAMSCSFSAAGFAPAEWCRRLFALKWMQALRLLAFTKKDNITT